MYQLVVIRPFGKYRVGDIIEDDPAIERVIASEHQNSVVRIIPKDKA